MVVVICCGCCFLQSTIAFVILLPNIYIRRCYISINFALMQFCLSVTATMSFIILSLLKFLPQVSKAINCLWFNYLLEKCQYRNTSNEISFVKFFRLNSFYVGANCKYLTSIRFYSKVVSLQVVNSFTENL